MQQQQHGSVQLISRNVTLLLIEALLLVAVISLSSSAALFSPSHWHLFYMTPLTHTQRFSYLFLYVSRHQATHNERAHAPTPPSGPVGRPWLHRGDAHPQRRSNRSFLWRSIHTGDPWEGNIRPVPHAMSGHIDGEIALLVNPRPQHLNTIHNQSWGQANKNRGCVQKTGTSGHH